MSAAVGPESGQKSREQGVTELDVSVYVRAAPPCAQASHVPFNLPPLPECYHSGIGVLPLRLSWHVLFVAFYAPGAYCPHRARTRFLNKVNLQVNLIQIFLHFLGGVLVSSFIKESWPYTYMWFKPSVYFDRLPSTHPHIVRRLLVAFFNIPTALIEIGILAAIHLFEIVIF